MALILLPNVLGKVDFADWLAPVVAKAVADLDGLIAESEQAGRRFLSAFKTKLPAREVPIALMPHEWKADDIRFLLEPVKKGENWGLVSDAGMPCIADPGAQLVTAARREGLQVVGYPGPSAPLLALMLSGFSGQQFSFHGYLQRDRKSHIAALQNRAIEDRAVQLFIEAPYRNNATLEELLRNLDGGVRLAVAWDLTTPGERVLVGTVHRWRQLQLPDLKGSPAIFMIAPAESRSRFHR